MKITVINTSKNVRQYINDIEENISIEESWEKTVIAPYWEKLCCYAPFDLSNRKPKAIKNITDLKRQCEIMEQIDTDMLENEFNKVTKILPNYDDDPLLVVIYPSDPDNALVNDNQNGVIGTALFGNLYIRVNPLIAGYAEWIKYVFAHEYHHTVWGNYWYMLHAGELENRFIESLVIDGEADSFALELYPSLRPKWVFGLTDKEIDSLWEQKYKDILNRTDIDYAAYMFGSREMEIPWCAGYAIGYRIVQNYLKKSKKTVIEILEVKPEELVELTTILHN